MGMVGWIGMAGKDWLDKKELDGRIRWTTSTKTELPGTWTVDDSKKINQTTPFKKMCTAMKKVSNINVQYSTWSAGTL